MTIRPMLRISLVAGAVFLAASPATADIADIKADVVAGPSEGAA